ncbi:unnamed protein product [Nippostrongylus brasiliensis]|uniref:Lipase_3 domain-containing protein n=1 Tax=Nippostrongylus brasiliensis TaxID=27835 RepID=A0A158R1N2_NIPBR|nr:unnamed protein product [Nippostrongylus brasiliensis]
MYVQILVLFSFFSRITSVDGSTRDDSASNDTKFDIQRALWVFDFAAGAYAVEPALCIRPHNGNLVFRITEPCDYLGDECWSIVATKDDWIVIAFRGTRTKIQLITELIETMSEPKKKLRAGGSVQHYFYIALQAIWNELYAVIQKLRKTYPTYKILFTGHSLGGALASLASTVFAHRHPALSDRIHLITYGQPRVGNFEYAVTHSQLVPNSWRIVHKYDLVAHLPACAIRLISHSCATLLNHSPYHHGTEIWFPENMTMNSLFKVCTGLPKYEDDSCSNGYYLHYGIRDHIRYFEHDVSRYGRNGCVDDPDRRWLDEELTSYDLS